MERLLKAISSIKQVMLHNFDNKACVLMMASQMTTRKSTSPVQTVLATTFDRKAVPTRMTPLTSDIMSTFQKEIASASTTGPIHGVTSEFGARQFAVAIGHRNLKMMYTLHIALSAEQFVGNNPTLAEGAKHRTDWPEWEKASIIEYKSLLNALLGLLVARRTEKRP